MIYLIKSAAYGESGYIELLKIGYTEDSNKDGRFKAYKMHNPTCKILYTIPDATEDQERWLHKYFKTFRYSEYGIEWYKYDNEILDFFDTHRDASSINELIVGSPRVISKIEVRSITDRLVRLLFDSGKINSLQAMSESKELTDRIFKELLNPSEFDSVYDWIKKEFGYTREDLKPYDIEDSELLQEFYLLPNYVDRMRLLCEKLDPGSKEELNRLPVEYEICYTTLGPDRLKGLGYQGSKIKSEMTKLLSEKDGTLKNILQLNFHIGDKYLRSEIKDILTNLYKENNISKAPKASDLENYFEIKPFKITNKATGKRDHGFEILGIKEDNEE